MTATIRVERRNGRTVYVVYPGDLPPMVFDFLGAAQIHCAVQDYEWRIDHEQAA